MITKQRVIVVAYSIPHPTWGLELLGLGKNVKPTIKECDNKDLNIKNLYLQETLYKKVF